MSSFRFGAQAIKTVDSINGKWEKPQASILTEELVRVNDVRIQGERGSGRPAVTRQRGQRKVGRTKAAKSPAAADVCRPVWTRVGKSVQMPNLHHRSAYVGTIRPIPMSSPTIDGDLTRKGSGKQKFWLHRKPIKETHSVDSIVPMEFRCSAMGAAISQCRVMPISPDQPVALATPRLLPDPVMRKLLDPQNHDRVKEDVSDAREVRDYRGFTGALSNKAACRCSGQSQEVIQPIELKRVSHTRSARLAARHWGILAAILAAANSGTQ
ncbi:hypothetical protein K438DRAFT_1761047 [Mycena galopus ATCC 62051]|nr:hypothetical protein K438DRAFT_1761047 [Mycena galopus ATCC 62051]